MTDRETDNFWHQQYSHQRSQTERLVTRLMFIRDSTFRNAASLRAVADDALNEYEVNKGTATGLTQKDFDLAEVKKNP